MAMRNVGIYGTAGVLVAVLIIAGVLMSGLRLPGFPLHKGTLTVLLTDAPVPLENLTVTITSLAIQEAKNGGESWVELAPPFVGDGSDVTVDLLQLVNKTRDLTTVEIDPGNYTKIRLGVEDAMAKYVGGGWEEVMVPSGKIDIIIRFEIEDGEEVILLIDVTADWIAISESGNLRPVLKAEATVISGD